MRVVKISQDEIWPAYGLVDTHAAGEYEIVIPEKLYHRYIKAMNEFFNLQSDLQILYEAQRDKGK